MTVAGVRSALFWFFAATLCVVLLLNEPAGAVDTHQMARRDPGEIDSLLSELKSKAMTGRMRFGKRAPKATYGSDYATDPETFSDRYFFLQEQ
uniref:Short neuropeptide F n=1 Tax=Steinernema glaseri TaxID=37863 RepID=A0A1I7Z3W0_9BILA